MSRTDPLKLRHALESLGCGQSTGFDIGGLSGGLETAFPTSFQVMKTGGPGTMLRSEALSMVSPTGELSSAQEC